MIYSLLRNYARFVLKLLNKGTFYHTREHFPETGPLILAPTHANSIMDGILVTCAIKRPIWFLMRGDMFNKSKFLTALLNACKIKPLFRPSEGKENMSENDITMAACVELFKQNEAVLIFPEGISLNQNELLPLKKGLARLAFMSKQEGIPIQISPITLNYEDYKSFGYKTNITFAKTVIAQEITEDTKEPKFVKLLTEEIRDSLNAGFNRIFKQNSFFGGLVYYLGWLLNFPIYFLAIFLAKKKAMDSVFFETVIFLVVLAILPFYWLLLGMSYFLIF